MHSEPFAQSGTMARTCREPLREGMACSSLEGTRDTGLSAAAGIAPLLEPSLPPVPSHSPTTQHSGEHMLSDPRSITRQHRPCANISCPLVLQGEPHPQQPALGKRHAAQPCSNLPLPCSSPTPTAGKHWAQPLNTSQDSLPAGHQTRNLGLTRPRSHPWA